jgi:hypothetical protein
MSESQRNFVILAVIAVIGVLFSGAFGEGAGIAFDLLNLVFAVLMVWFVVWMYQRNSGTIATLPSTPRLVLHVAGVGLLVLVATGFTRSRFLPWPFGWSASYPVAFWGLLLACCFAIWWSWQQRTSRW